MGNVVEMIEIRILTILKAGSLIKVLTGLSSSEDFKWLVDLHLLPLSSLGLLCVSVSIFSLVIRTPVM